MTIASNLLQRHILTLVDDNAKADTHFWDIGRAVSFLCRGPLFAGSLAVPVG
jgi:hypothetical protein